MFRFCGVWCSNDLFDISSTKCFSSSQHLRYVMLFHCSCSGANQRMAVFIIIATFTVCFTETVKVLYHLRVARYFWLWTVSTTTILKCSVETKRPLLWAIGLLRPVYALWCPLVAVAALCCRVGPISFCYSALQWTLVSATYFSRCYRVYGSHVFNHHLNPQKMPQITSVAHDPAGEASVDWYYACGLAHHPWPGQGWVQKNPSETGYALIILYYLLYAQLTAAPGTAMQNSLCASIYPELEAYAGVISALRAQGDLTKDKKDLLGELTKILG